MVYNMKIIYGTETKNIDVTAICYEKLMTENIIRIPIPNETELNCLPTLYMER